MAGISNHAVKLTIRSALICTLAAGSALSVRAEGELNQGAVDVLVEQVKQGATQASLPVALSIDHARLARQAGSAMPPATVVMVRDPVLEARWLQADPDLALELPLRVLIHQAGPDSSPQLSRQAGAALLQRHGLRDASLAALYDNTTTALLQQVPNSAVQAVPALESMGDGIVSISSPLDLVATRQRVLEIIQAQSDTVLFAEIRFETGNDAAQSTSPITLILFGGPGPGGRAMAENTLLGLDAFCQKLLIREDSEGKVVVRFNDLTWIATRQGIPVSPVLQAINTRLINTFQEGLARQGVHQ